MSILSHYKNLAKSLAELFQPFVQVALLDDKNKLIVRYPDIEMNSQGNKVTHIAIDSNYSLEIAMDLSIFEPFQIFLQKFIPKTDTSKVITSWQVQIDHYIFDYCSKQNIPLNKLSSKHKRELVLTLNQNGFFGYQDASKYLASKLNVSRATIYNYLSFANKIKSIDLHQVDAFTDEPFSGNPAGVVFADKDLSEAIMKKITREMNLSETAFIFPSDNADYHLRYFTPSGHEVKFCGHSTVGALFMIAQQGKYNEDKEKFFPVTLETEAGKILSEIEVMKDSDISIRFQTPEIALSKSKFTHTQLAEHLGINVKDFDLNKSLMFDKINQDLFITINSLEQLKSIEINIKTAKKFAEDNNIVAFCLLTNETLAIENQIHMRCYAPAVGIPEDPFTGSVLGGLANYVITQNLVSKHLTKIGVEQGHFIDRPGFVELHFASKTSKRAWVNAKAKHFFSTQISI